MGRQASLSFALPSPPPFSSLRHAPTKKEARPTRILRLRRKPNPTTKQLPLQLKREKTEKKTYHKHQISKKMSCDFLYTSFHQTHFLFFSPTTTTSRNESWRRCWKIEHTWLTCILDIFYTYLRPYLTLTYLLTTYTYLPITSPVYIYSPPPPPPLILKVGSFSPS